MSVTNAPGSFTTPRWLVHAPESVNTESEPTWYHVFVFICTRVVCICLVVYMCVLCTSISPPVLEKGSWFCYLTWRVNVTLSCFELISLIYLIGSCCVFCQWRYIMCDTNKIDLCYQCQTVQPYPRWNATLLVQRADYERQRCLL